MNKVFRVVVLGLHHDHVWSHLEDLERCASATLVGVADPNLALLNRVRGQFQQSVTHTDYDGLLAEVEADIAYIFANNRLGAELAVTAAKQGLHVMIEKPMAVCNADDQAKGQFTINLTLLERAAT